MRILVAGGTGQIGDRFSGLLTRRGHDVWVLTRRPERFSLRSGIHYIAWDAATVTDWGKLIDGADVVLNLAGENIGGKPWTAKQLARIRGSRVRAGAALMEAIKQAKRPPAMLLQASAIGYYGTERGEPLDESSPAGKDTLADICLEWEGATRGVEEFGTRHVIVRTGLVFEKDRGVLPRMLLPFRLFAGGPLGDGRQVLSWIHLDDQFAAMRFLIESSESSGAYNLTAPAPVTNAEFGRVLADVIHRPFWLPVPAWGLKLLFGEMSKLVLEGQRVLPGRLTQAGFTFKFPELRPALEDLLG